MASENQNMASENENKFFHTFYRGDGIPRALKEKLDKYFHPSSIPIRFKNKLQKPTEDENLENKFDFDTDYGAGPYYEASAELAEAVNLAMVLRRPLLLMGNPGCGKTSLAYSIAWELRLKPVLKWSIHSSSTIKEGLYRYDAIGRLNALQILPYIKDQKEIEALSSMDQFISLGPLGTALANRGLPNVLLIDEIDKSDIDFPDELLHELEEFSFEIPELQIYGKQEAFIKPYNYFPKTEDKKENPKDRQGYVKVEDGRVSGGVPPIVVITSNRERELSGAFQRRCISFDIKSTPKQIEKIIFKSFNHAQSPPILSEEEIRKELNRLKEKHSDAPLCRLLDWFLVYRESASEEGERRVLEEPSKKAGQNSGERKE